MVFSSIVFAGASQLDPSAKLDTSGVPVVALAGTCMDSGKTAAACAIVSRLRHLGFRIAACKATGVSLRRDILTMEDAGALAFTVSLSDAAPEEVSISYATAGGAAAAAR